MITRSNDQEIVAMLLGIYVLLPIILIVRVTRTKLLRKLALKH